MTVDFCNLNFEHASRLNYNKNEGTKWKPSYVGIFTGYLGITSIKLKNIGTNNITNIDGLFYASFDLTSITFENVDFSSVESAEELFYTCKSLEQVNIDDVNLCNVHYMSRMFKNCEKIERIEFKKTRFRGIKTIDGICYSCYNLKYADFSQFRAFKNSEFGMGTAFSNCKNLVELDLSNLVFDIEDYSERFTFYECKSLCKHGKFNVKVKDIHTYINLLKLYEYEN